MPSLEAELCWGDERVELEEHPLGARIGRGADVFFPCASFAPFETREGETHIAIPPGAIAMVNTANGWRDMRTLRVLGCLAPHPRLPGATVVRVRSLRGATSAISNAAPAPRPEVWLEAEGWRLRLAISDDVPRDRTPRFDRRFAHAAAFLGAATLIWIAASAALASVPPRRYALDLARPQVITVPLPRFESRATVRPSETLETKHRVRRRAAGGGATPDPIALAARPEPRAAGEPVARAGTSSIERASDGARPIERSEVERLAGLRGQARSQRAPAAAWSGPLESGWGGGQGVRLPQPLPHRHVAGVWSAVSREPRAGGGWRASCFDDDSGAIRSTLDRIQTGMNSCYASTRSERAGIIEIQWSIALDGSIDGVRLVRNEPNDPMLESCVRARARGWRFPALDCEYRVTLPFMFHYE